MRRKKALASAVKAIKKNLSAPAEAEKLLPRAYKVIDKAAKRGVLKANTAARKKARLVAAVRRAQKQEA